MEGVSLQGIQVLSQDSDGDILKLTRHKGQLGLVQRLRKRAVRFIEKYASFLDGLVAPPTEVTVETIERYVLSSYTVIDQEELQINIACTSVMMTNQNIAKLSLLSSVSFKGNFNIILSSSFSL